jgi:hypothetical protein
MDTVIFFLVTLMAFPLHSWGRPRQAYPEYLRRGLRNGLATSLQQGLPINHSDLLKTLSARLAQCLSQFEGVQFCSRSKKSISFPE